MAKTDEKYNHRYYISTGLERKMYTLREEYNERWGRDFAYRDHYVCNLSTDPKKAETKAKEITGVDLIADFELGQITHRSLDWTVFQFGKHIGEPIADVLETDFDYCVWVAQNMAYNKRNAKNIALIMEDEWIVAKLAQIEKEQSEQEVLLEQKTSDRIARFAPLVKVLKAKKGRFVFEMARSLGRGDTIHGKAVTIVADIYAKSKGKPKSEEYKAAYDNAVEWLNEDS